KVDPGRSDPEPVVKRRDLTEVRFHRQNALIFGGGGEIRTHGGLRHGSFQDYSDKPLPHPTRSGGRGGIRTHDGIAAIPVFETSAFNHSATLPHFRGGKPPLSSP